MREKTMKKIRVSDKDYKTLMGLSRECDEAWVREMRKSGCLGNWRAIKVDEAACESGWYLFGKKWWKVLAPLFILLGYALANIYIWFLL
jgi:hypothetical protein